MLPSGGEPSNRPYGPEGADFSLTLEMTALYAQSVV